jgi:hypothetical protein
MHGSPAGPDVVTVLYLREEAADQLGGEHARVELWRERWHLVLPGPGAGHQHLQDGAPQPQTVRHQPNLLTRYLCRH